MHTFCVLYISIPTQNWQKYVTARMYHKRKYREYCRDPRLTLFLLAVVRVLYSINEHTRQKVLHQTSRNEYKTAFFSFVEVLQNGMQYSLTYLFAIPAYIFTTLDTSIDAMKRHEHSLRCLSSQIYNVCSSDMVSIYLFV